MNNQNLFLKKWIMQSEGNIVTKMNGEVVMLNIQNSKYYNLGEIGGEIWKKLDQPITIEQLVQQLILEYNVEKNECEQHVLSFLHHLMDQDLIQITEQASTSQG